MRFYFVIYTPVKFNLYNLCQTYIKHMYTYICIYFFKFKHLNMIYIFLNLNICFFFSLGVFLCFVYVLHTFANLFLFVFIALQVYENYSTYNQVVYCFPGTARPWRKNHLLARTGQWTSMMKVSQCVTQRAISIQLEIPQ